MKKLIVLICMVLCVAVIGSVLAIAVYPAGDVSGNVSTDTYLYLTVDTQSVTNVTLEKGMPAIIPVVLGVDTNAGALGKATFKVTAAASGDKSIEHVSVGLYSDSACKTAIGTGNDITMADITATQTVYVRLLLDQNATDAQVNGTSGTLTLSLTQAA